MAFQEGDIMCSLSEQQGEMRCHLEGDPPHGVGVGNPTERWQVERDEFKRVELLKREIQLKEIKLRKLQDERHKTEVAWEEVKVRLKETKVRRKAAEVSRKAAEVRLREAEVEIEEAAAKRRKFEVRLPDAGERVEAKMFENGGSLPVAELEMQVGPEQSQNWSAVESDVTMLRSKLRMLRV